MTYSSFLENFFLSIGDFFNNSSFVEELKKWRQIQFLSEKELGRIQRTKLTRLLNHASREVAFYKDLDIEPKKDPFQWLKEFPIIKKQTIKNNIDKFLFEDKRNLIPYASSGSSGIQSLTYMSKKEQSIIRAILILWWEWAGYKTGAPILQTGMTPQRNFLKTLKDFLFRTDYFVAFNFDEDKARSTLLNHRNQSHHFIGGYASSLFALAMIARDSGISNLNFKAAISWGDKMFPQYRKLIESTFNTKVYDTYACNEGIMIGAQRDSDYYYIMTPHVHLEIVDALGNEVPDGKLGHVLVTRLDGYSMPLIRYYLGDLAIKLPRTDYPSDRILKFPLLQKIIGRDTDIARAPSGKMLIVHFFTGIFEFYPQIKQFRIVQRVPSEIQIEYIPDQNFEPAVLESITLDMIDRAKEELVIEFIKVDHIPSTASGKPQIIQSFIEGQGSFETV